MLQKSSVASVVLMSPSCNKQLIHPHDLMYGKFMPRGKKKKIQIQRHSTITQKVTV